MQPDTSKWRLNSTYDYINGMTPDGYAWEFLRRNKDYQHDFQNHFESGSADKEDQALEQRWGLRFFRGTASQLTFTARFLVTNDQYGGSDSDRDATRFCDDRLPPAIICHDQKRRDRHPRLQRERYRRIEIGGRDLALEAL